MPSDKPHRLNPLVNPKSVAVVGAKGEPGSSGYNVLQCCLGGSYAGEVYLVNPSRDEIDGRKCYPSLKDIPEPVDLAALVLGNNRIETVFEDAVAAGVRAAVVYGSCLVEDDRDRTPSLRERILSMAADNGMALCGFNCAGFMNREAGLSLQLQEIGSRNVGTACLLSQSGSMYATLVHNGGRLDYNFTVSTGQEVITDLTDYMDYALNMESTRTIGLFIETVRKPEAFIHALKMAAEKDIAVVALKVARTEKAKQFAMSHSGAIAGDDSGFDAVFREYGVLRTHDANEFMATMQLLDCGKRAGKGGLAAIADSGGERELLADLAAENGIELAEINTDTKARIESAIEYGVEAENPLDAWNTGQDYERIFHQSMHALMDDPDTAVGVWIADMHDDLVQFEAYSNGAIAIAAENDKPQVFATCYTTGSNDRLVGKLAPSGIPILEGMRPAMIAVRNLLDYRDYHATRKDKPAPPAGFAEATGKWRSHLQKSASLKALEIFELIGDFAIPVIRTEPASDEASVIATANGIGYPVVMKTANDGILHKSDVGGVVLNLADADAVAGAYKSMNDNLGPDVVISAMAEKGTELAFGLVHDELFGPLAMIAAGGVYIEQFRDAVFAVPPVDPDKAKRLIDRLAIRPVLNGVRGAEPADMDALARAFSNFTHLVALLGNDLKELDINPVIAGPTGVMAVDALVVAAGQD